MHTNCTVEQDKTGMAEVLDFGRATLRILRRKLLKNIADAKRIFVFKSKDPAFSQIEMHQLHLDLRRIGPVCLLCVKEAPCGERAGSSERLAEELYLGYVDKFVTPGEAPSDHWLSICAETMALRGRD
jgi:hypothetical protein